MFSVDTASVIHGLDAAILEIEHVAEHELEQLAEHVVERARSAAPVDTGNLKSSIRVIASGHDDGGAFVDIGTDDPVGIYQEFGTVNIPPHPFMRPALAEAPNEFGKGI